MVQNGDVRLRLVNDKLGEVEMQQINKEVKLLRLRLLMFWKILISMFRKFKKVWKLRIGEMYCLKLKINTKFNGLMIGKRWRRILLFKQYGQSQEATNSATKQSKRRMLMQLSQNKVNKKRNQPQHDYFWNDETSFAKVQSSIEILFKPFC